MDIWTDICWKNTIANGIRKGIRFRFDKNVDCDARAACLKYGRWLRNHFDFPIRVVVYVKDKSRIKAMDGDLVFGTFFRPYEFNVEPYIKIAAGDYKIWEGEEGRNDALASLLHILSHELTHYFQYVNDARLTPKGEEIQATKLANKRIAEYSCCVDEP